MYGADVLTSVDVREGGARLGLHFRAATSTPASVPQPPTPPTPPSVDASEDSRSEDNDSDSGSDSGSGTEEGDLTIGGPRSAATSALKSFLARSQSHPTQYNEDDEEIEVYEGEIRSEVLVVRNIGDRSVKDVWLVLPSDGSVWINCQEGEDREESDTLAAQKPYHLEGVVLEPGEEHEISISMRHTGEGVGSVSVISIFREVRFIVCYFCLRAD